MALGLYIKIKMEQELLSQNMSELYSFTQCHLIVFVVAIAIALVVREYL